MPARSPQVVPLHEIAQTYGVSQRTVWKWVRQFGLQKYQVPGKGKQTYLDPAEVRQKVRPIPKNPGS